MCVIDVKLSQSSVRGTNVITAGVSLALGASTLLLDDDGDAKCAVTEFIHMLTVDTGRISGCRLSLPWE
jgi:hypothetical protein